MAAPAADLGKTGDRLYRFSTWVHEGPDAGNCEAIDEEAGTNDCSNPLHFHAWCRLPNPLVHREIREIALAAKARRTRQLRDPESDAHLALEDEIDRVVRGGEESKESVITELLKADSWRDHMEAVADVMEIEAPDQPADEDTVYLYAHIEADQDRYVELGTKLMEWEGETDDFPDKEELDRLDAHIRAYNDEVQERLKQIEAPRRKALEEKSISELADQIRDQRIDVDSNAQFVHHYNLHQWLRCTYESPQQKRRVFPDKSTLEGAAEEVIFAVQDAYNDLSAARQEAMQGNS